MSFLRAIDARLHRVLFRDIAVAWRWPPGVDPAGWERCTFRGAEGNTLVGLFGAAEGPPDEPPRAVVVAVHPVRPDAKGYFLRSGVAAMLRAARCAVLLPDLNGFGESAFASFDYPVDVKAAVAEARRRAPGAPVILLGACFGASAALPLLTHGPHAVDAVVVEGAPSSWDGYFAGVPSARSWKQRWIGWRGRFVLRFGTLVHPRLRVLLHPLSHLRHATGLRGVLFLYGEGDPLIPAHVGEALHAACRTAWGDGGPVCHFWKTRTTRHLGYYQADPDGYRAAMLGFLDAVAAPQACAA